MKSTRSARAELRNQSNKVQRNVAEKPVPVVRAGAQWWHYAVGAAVALMAAFIIYGPALSGPFMLDDMYLPFMSPVVATLPMRLWLGVRPLLMASFWLNWTTNGIDPYWYHWVNVFLHCCNALLAYAIVRRFLTWADEHAARRELLSLFAGALFLVHPLQTESVAYVASRSENLSVFFFLAAFAVFVYRRRGAVSFPLALAVLALFAAAASTKEHTVVLPALLLLTDYYFNPGFSFEGIKRNWKLYLLVAAGAAAGAAFAVYELRSARTAGFGIKDFRWYEYLFTQFRAICGYLGLFVLPFGQNIDHDFPVSRTIFEHGAIAYGLVLLGLAVAAWRYHRAYPLASYGYFGYLLLLAPTSSVIPIQDVFVEHRLYLPFICLLLITVDFLRRWRTTSATLGATMGGVILILSVLTFNRNQLWADSVLLWQDAAIKSPQKSRPRFQLAYAYWHSGRCVQADTEYANVAKLQPVDTRLLVDWALAKDCAGNVNGALDKLKQAEHIDGTAEVYSMMGMEYGKLGQTTEAFAALDRAQQSDPQFVVAYLTRGNVYAGANDYARAKEQYLKALSIDPSLEAAKQNLAVAEQHLGPSAH